jgi:hypothetical protein
MIIALPEYDGTVRVEIKVAGEAPVVVEAFANEIRQIDVVLPAGTVELIECYPSVDDQRAGEGWVLKNSVWERPNLMTHSVDVDVTTP